MNKNRLIIFNKPYQVLSQFTDSNGRVTLSNFINIPRLYPAGRLDYDSEGLLLLTNVGWLQHMITSPTNKWPKTYWVQVEGVPSEVAIDSLRNGVLLRDGWTKPAVVQRITPPELWPRNPPIRKRVNISDSWLEITIQEGRNRQIRRMTACTGHPTLRLVRWRIGDYTLGHLSPGEYQDVPCPSAKDVANRWK